MNGSSGRQARRRILWAAVLIGLLAALWSASARWRVESANKSVEITLDYAELRSLAYAVGKPLPEVLTAFKQAGATSVAVQEDSIGALEEARILRVAYSPDPNATDLITRSTNQTKRITDALAHHGQTDVATLTANAPDEPTLHIGAAYNFVRGVGLGLDPEVVKAVRDAGLQVTGRISNWRGVTPDGMAWALNDLKARGVTSVIFSGDDVLGWKGLVVKDPKHPDTPTTASLLADSGLTYGLVEFGKQKGDVVLARAAAPQTVRVHTITGPEMVNADMPSNVQRFGLAARERDIRVLYVRLFPDEADALTANTEYVRSIAREATGRGLRLGQASGFAPLAVRWYVRLLIGLGLGAAWLLLVDSITGLFGPNPFGSNRAARLVFGVSAVVALGFVILPVLGGIGARLAALSAACVYPSLALLRRDHLREAEADGDNVGHVLRRFFEMCAVTSLGIASIIGLLADRLYLIKVDAFMGIKGAQLVPVLLVALVYGLHLRTGTGRTFADALREARERIARLATQPILLWQVGAALVFLVVLVMLVLRSGNDPGVGVSASELKFRALLDRLLYARPRFKEFLIGHPAMLLALFCAARRWRVWPFPLFLAGAIGQVSYLNTFCHIHTPILISLARALLGIGIGVIIGLVLDFVIRAFARRFVPVSRAELRSVPVSRAEAR